MDPLVVEKQLEVVRNGIVLVVVIHIFVVFS